MPLYEYRCAGCGLEQENLLPMSAAGASRSCPSCGAEMKQKVSVPMPAIVAVDNRGRLVNSLNDDPKHYELPGSSGQRERYKRVIGESLNAEKPVIGRGFG